jgi:hypothetical protein
MLSQEISERISGAGKRKVFPGDFLRGKGANLESFVHGLGVTADDIGQVYDDHHRIAGIRVDIEELGDLDFEIDFFPRLPDCGIFHTFASIQESAREHPLTIAWLNTTSEQDNFTVNDGNRTCGHFGIVIENERTLTAHKAFGFINFKSLAIQSASTFGAKLEMGTGMMFFILERMFSNLRMGVLMVMIVGHTGPPCSHVVSFYHEIHKWPT